MPLIRASLECASIGGVAVGCGWGLKVIPFQPQRVYETQDALSPLLCILSVLRLSPNMVLNISKQSKKQSSTIYPLHLWGLPVGSGLFPSPHPGIVAVSWSHCLAMGHLWNPLSSFLRFLSLRYFGLHLGNRIFCNAAYFGWIQVY